MVSEVQCSDDPVAPWESVPKVLAIDQSVIIV